MRNQKVFYITYNVGKENEITTPVYAREDICNIIDRALFEEDDPVGKKLIGDILALHALLLGVYDYKGGKIFIPDESKMMN